ncbi:MAG TPA: hypothetical protein VFV38_43805 [Ktedonobacteraceae bacterium]|nr:hypothetical protein [Ktedonobacteraceae bacterium]
MWLVVVDTAQIQPYVFGSNRLRENVGASYLVDAVTGAWAFEVVTKIAPTKHNIGPQDVLNDAARIEAGCEAEVLYAGGGNFVVLFDILEKVKNFQTHLSQRVLLEAPGLQVVIAQQELDWYNHVLREKLDEVFDLLAEQKRKRAWSAPLLGLGVTASCNSTGLSATGIVPGIGGDPGYLASDEIRAKVAIALPQHSSRSEADRRLQETIFLPDIYRYPTDFEDLGATEGEYSYIALVHADGNRVGQSMREIGEGYTTAKQNRECVQALRTFSHKIQQAAATSLQAVVDQIVERIDEGKDGGKVLLHPLGRENPKLVIQLKRAKKDGRPYLPFRPIVFGGDDVTFVCDGRLGLSLASAYLHAFEQETKNAHLGKDGGRLTACAGIAIVKSHYPFARAYDLTVELTRSAKYYREEQGIAGSCLDWHFAASGLGGSLEEIRAREYQVNAGSLTLRPVALAATASQEQRTWPVVLAGIRAFQHEEWAERRNKIKALRDALREGPEAVAHFLVAFHKGDLLPEVLSETHDWQKRGWDGGLCGYFDAIELVDWFIPLEGVAHEAPAITSAS